MIGQLLDGRYRLRKVLGKGGFGRTFLAQDTKRPGQPSCVVKHLKPESTEPSILGIARRLFQSEAEALEKLGEFDQIPRLYAYFEENQEFYLVQEFIDGTPLNKEIQAGKPWPEPKVIQFLKEVLPILLFLHSKDVIHRDLKPDNIIRRKSDNKLVLIDFGAVKQVVKEADPTNLTVAIGTSGYIAAEQAQGKPRFASDIYAVGIMAIQALTGVSPTDFPEDDDGEVVWRPYVGAVSPQLAAVLEKMVRRDFQKRHESVLEVLDDLEHRREGLVTQLDRPILEKQAKNILLAAGIMIALGALRIAWGVFRPIEPTAPACVASTFATVKNIPQGQFSYTGHPSWTGIRERMGKSVLDSAQPNFRLQFTPLPLESHWKMLTLGKVSFVEGVLPLDANAKALPLSHRVIAVDPTVFAVSPQLSIPGLTQDQIKAIYTGQITNWQQVGGPDRSITPYASPYSPQGWFATVLLSGARVSDRVFWVLDVSEAVQKLALDPGGIYFSSAALLMPRCSVRPLAVSLSGNATFVAPYEGELKFSDGCRRTPNRKAFAALQYPFYRELAVFYPKDQQDVGLAYSNLLLTDEGQRLVEGAGFVPIRAAELCRPRA